MSISGIPKGHGGNIPFEWGIVVYSVTSEICRNKRDYLTYDNKDGNTSGVTVFHHDKRAPRTRYTSPLKAEDSI